MTNTLRTLGFCLILVLLAASCKTYYIPVERFKEQFRGLDSLQMREASVRGPLGDKVKYKTYPIDFIKAVDKKGNPVNIPNSPSIEIRVTDTLNQKTIFYFDQIQFDGENIIGRQSRIVSSFQKTIPIRAIRKIEVQNGRKNFRYVQ